MRLERVRRHVRVVAPDMLEQSLAGHWLLFGAMEITQDRRFFLGQPQFDTLRVDKVLRSWPEGVRADLELRILARFILPKLRADTGQAARRTGTACRRNRWRRNQGRIRRLHPYRALSA